MKANSLFLFLILISIKMTAQNSSQIKPCSAPEASQFDFWIGDWNLTWNDTSHGTNHVLKVMDGCTVNENFNNPVANYLGQSWSVYNPNYKIWQQTWVDNTGGYIALTGKYENGIMTLSTESRKLPDNSEIVFQMVYYHITLQRFDWKWQSSTDGGKTWKINWLIHYERKA